MNQLTAEGSSQKGSDLGKAVLKVDNLRKSYGQFKAVDDLSFAVHHGEIFGLLGPNGAGKTTTIRMIMDIFKADHGTVSVLDRSPKDARPLVGYLPEERGLYRDLKVKEALVYLARLKGTDGTTANQKATYWLERVGLAEWSKKRVKDLSRGMQQKVQFVASLVHDPDLLILDEPFQGLDPVNVEMIKDLIRELARSGKTIVLSAHGMNLVEALCDRILLMNRGRAVLYGDLAQIKADHAPRTVRVTTEMDLDELPGVEHITRQDGVLLLEMADSATPQQVLHRLVERNVPIKRFEVASVPLAEIFISVVTETAEENVKKEDISRLREEVAQ